MILQKTIKSSVSLQGVGLHSGQMAEITLRPALPNRGIVFVRTDLGVEISAHYRNVVNTQLATTIGRGKATISTVEHILAALQGMGIDNAICEVNGPEVPILDGSSEAFCVAIESVGVQSQLQPRAQLLVRRKVEVRSEDGEKVASIEPSSKLEIHATIDWKHPSIGFQELHYVENRNSFSEIASARTFGFLRDVEALKRMGLARGGSLDNAVVLDEDKVLNPDGLRYADEFVRHKVLDALGDFKLAGIAIQGYVRLHRAGHDLHSQLLAAIFANPDNYEIVVDSLGEQVEKRPARSARIPAFA
jgi:UDP-3-O-[3-hydroxymyristoyl] N-acetylglucosamine deacetylase